MTSSSFIKGLVIKIEQEIKVHNNNKVVAWKMKGSKSQEKLLTSFMNNPDIK
jgi:hypothetical protein